MSDADSESDRPRRPKRWFQYSLRTALVLLLVFSLLFSWLAVKMREARKQADAVAALHEFRGNVTYDYELDPSGKRIPNQKAVPNGPAWLRNWLGEDFFCSVVEARVYDDAAIEQTTKLPALNSLIIWCSRDVTDAGLAHLKEMPQLRKLRFGIHQNVTDAGFANVGALVNLEELDMRYGQFSDEALQHLAQLPRLRKLTLGHRITDAGLQHLHGLTQLEELDLDSTDTTSSGVEALQKALPNCEVEW